MLFISDLSSHSSLDQQTRLDPSRWLPRETCCPVTQNRLISTTLCLSNREERSLHLVRDIRHSHLCSFSNLSVIIHRTCVIDIKCDWLMFIIRLCSGPVCGHQSGLVQHLHWSCRRSREKQRFDFTSFNIRLLSFASYLSLPSFTIYNSS